MPPELVLSNKKRNRWYAMLDIHAHILPTVDDGAKDIEESLALLQRLKEQGITDVVLTPHFNANMDNLDAFFELIKNTENQLRETIKHKDLPNIHLGCEVRFFFGMGKCEKLRDFTLAGSDYLLVELSSFAPITKAVIKEITELSENLDIVPIIAHIERCAHLRGFKKLMSLIGEEKILTQVNAQSVAFDPLKKICIKLIKDGCVTFLASDCHSIDKRPPEFENAYNIIEKECGSEYVTALKQNSKQLKEEIC